MDINVPVIALALTEQTPSFAQGKVIPVIALALTAQAPAIAMQVHFPVIALSLTVGAFAVAIEADIPVIALTLTANVPVFARGKQIPVVALALTANRPQFTLEPPANQAVRYVYRCYLTGDAEDPPIADIELPLASFQSRRRNGEQTYLAVTVPNPVPYVSAINARLNGDLVIYSGFALGDTETLTELLRVNFGSFRYDLGPRSGSASLSGHKQVTYSNPKTRVLSGVSYQSVTDGITRVRCDPDMWLNPGDTADIGNSTTFIVDTITYTINPDRSLMEVAEVSA